mmetsp:Transcript_26783/g.77370  ORF Transcript_26783/g.77370 Transcript_26783/m.77370 type:complete len:466 (-) Transcript_26783:101-1498(-)
MMADVASIRRSNSEAFPYMDVERKDSSLFVPPEANCSDHSDDDIPDELAQEGISKKESLRSLRMKFKAMFVEKVRKLRRQTSMLQPVFEPAVEHEVKIWTDDFKDKRHCLESGQLKPMRPRPHLKASELLSGLKQNRQGRWEFADPINGWPAFSKLVLKSIVRRSKFGPLGVGKEETVVWTAESGAALPKASEFRKGTRAIFMAPMWTSIGWSPESPGFAWWFSAQLGSPRLLFGEAMVRQLEDDPAEYANAQATVISCWAHRYAVQRDESFRDSLTWHAGILVEWSHGKFTTLIEVAWQNGVGGYGGKSNWIPDKMDPNPALYRVTPDSMKRPFNDSLSEVRLIDMPAKNKDEFLETWLLKYSSKGELPLEMQRFFDPQIYASKPCRLRRCTPADLAGYCLNYISRAFTYEQLTSNCQTFTSDCFAFLTGSPETKPFSQILQPGYKQSSMAFLYRPKYADASPS